MSDTHHEEAHTGPIQTPKQLLLAVAYSFILPVLIIIGLVYYVTSDNKPQAGASNAPESVAARIQKVGSVDIKSANAEPRSGEEVFKGQCGGCHSAGTLGSPKFGDAAAWGPRIGKGYEALLTSALKGKGNMASQAGGEYSDFEIGRAVVYMANAGGGKLAQPQPAAAK
jgi:cytochrome c5